MPYVDPQTIDNPTAGQPIPAAWSDQVRNDLEYLVDPPACSVYHNTTATVATATPSALAANSEFFDNDSMHSTSTNNTRITATTAGRYEFNATIRFDPDADGVRRGAFRVNGTTIYESMQVPGVSSLRSCVITCTRKIVLAAGDYVEVLAEHTAGNNLAVELYEFAAKWETR